MPQQFRGVKNVFTSVYENIIVVISYDNRVDILNYEFMVAVRGLQFSSTSNPIHVVIVEGLRHLLISCSDGNIYIFKFLFETYQKFNIDLISKIKLNSLVIYEHKEANINNL